MPLRSRAVLLSICLAGACGDDAPSGPDAAGGPRDWPLQTVPDETIPEPGIRREVIRIDGFTPPANPVTGETTPPALDRTQIVRFRTDATTPAPARAIVLAYPGFLGGSGSWEHLARHIVRSAAEAGVVIEVWAIDRRANLLEDLVGLDTAEATGNAAVADGYYFGLDTIDGRAFEGFVAQDALSYASEWGLETHVEDLRRVVELVAPEARRARVFLMGHSLGASFAEAFAAWRFPDGSRGVDDLAGLLLVDGLLAGEPLSEAEYEAGVSGGFASIPGVDTIRERGPRYFELPFFGVSALARVEILSLRALQAPQDVIVDEGRDRALQLQLQLGAREPPPMTNRAALGWAMDDGSNGIVITAVSCGEPTGGAVEEYENALGGGTLVRPAELDVTYDWQDATDADPTELTPLDNLAHAFVDGPSNFAEWYFPVRLSLDLAAVGGAQVPDDGWQAARGLRAFDGAAIDAPILAVATELITAAEYQVLADRVAPTVGQGRPAAGAGRDELAGLRIIDVPAMTHVDPLTAAARADNPIPAAVVDFVTANTEPGGVVVP